MNKSSPPPRFRICVCALAIHLLQPFPLLLLLLQGRVFGSDSIVSLTHSLIKERYAINDESLLGTPTTITMPGSVDNNKEGNNE